MNRVTPNEIVRRLGITGLAFRNWLRDKWRAGDPRFADHQINDRWSFSVQLAAKLGQEHRAEHGGRGVSASVRPPRTSTPKAPPARTAVPHHLATIGADAVRVLRGSAASADDLDDQKTGHPGLYAFYASPETWEELGLGTPPDARPLYVGKAEKTLASRDVEGHFGMRERGVQSPTGGSTLRRSLAALLAPERGYRGIPRNPGKPGRFSNFGLSEAHDDDLSGWMKGRLTLALWPHDEVAALDAIETQVLQQLLPPLNLDKVATPWRDQVKAARKLLAAEARAWRA